MLKKYVILVLLALSQQSLGTVIVNSDYDVGEDTLYAPSTNGEPAFEITVSDVYLDFHQYLLQQDPTTLTTTMIAVLVDPGLTGVVIQNGNFLSVNGQGISVSSGCTEVTIQNMQISDFADESIITNGTVNAPVTNLTLQNSSVILSSTDPNNTAAISLNYTNNASLLNLDLQENGANNYLSVIRLANCEKANIDTCNVNLNTALGIKGFDFYNSSESLINACNSFDNIATSSSAHGFLIESNSSGLFFQDCTAQGNLTQTTTGFSGNGYTVLNSTACDFDSCDGRLNAGTGSGSTANGFYGLNSSLVNLLNCTYSNNTHMQSYGNAYGINWNNMTTSSIQNCIAKANNGLNSSTGCLINGCNHCAIIGNQFIFNNGGPTNAGLNVINATKRIALYNVAFDNGLTATSQIIGLNTNETDDINSTSANLDNETSSWVNLRIY